MPNTTYLNLAYDTELDPATADIWGTKLNAQIVALDAYIALEEIYGIYDFISSGTYKLKVKCRHAGTITSVTTISESGTCTATFKINSTALGGTANSVSSSEQTQTHASANTFVAGDDIVMTISDAIACRKLSFNIYYTRTSAGTAP